MNLLFSFAGRIGRGKFWLGFLAQVLLLIVVIAAVSFVIPWDQVMGMVPEGETAAGTTDPVAAPISMWSALQPAIWIGVAGYLLFLWWALAVAAKRCHDRGKSAWWLLIFAPSMLASLAGYWILYQHGGDFITASADSTYSMLQIVAGITGLIAFIWWLVDLGILEGEEGENRWGPNPVPPTD